MNNFGIKHKPRGYTSFATAGILSLILAVVLSAGGGLAQAAPLAAISPTLGAVGSYSVLAGSIVTNTGATTLPGDLGISPSIGVSPHFTGFPPGIVGPPGTFHDADTSAAAAQADNTAVFAFLDQNCSTTYAGVQDMTLVSPLGPGVYCADAFILSGNLTLSGSGVWIFKSAATLTTSSNSSVTSSDPCNVWWRLVSSGTLGTGTHFTGNILALTSISLQTGASLSGRALAQTGAVTLDSNIITTPVCTSVATATATPTVTPTATRTPTPTRIPTATPTATATALPPATARPTTTAIPPSVPGTGFARGSNTNLSKQPADKLYASLGGLWLEIPRLGVQMPIVGVPQTADGWDVDWLSNQAGWLQGTAFPTWAGNSVLTGHVYDASGNPGPFVRLNQMWYGDKIIVHAWGAQYVYEVREVTQVGPKDTAAMLKHQEQPRITLVTCRGYDAASNSYKYRVLVRAALVKTN